MSEGREGLLEIRHRLPVGRPREGLAGGLTEVAHRLRPDLAPERMMGEPLDLLDRAVGVQRLDRLHDLGVQVATSVLQQAP